MKIHGLRFRLLLAALPLWVAALSQPARAQEPNVAPEQSHGWAHTGSGSAFLQGVWGIDASTDDYSGWADHSQASMPYAFGIGARAGYTFSFKLYVGARAAYHFGRDGWAVWNAKPGGSGGESGLINYDIGEEGGTLTLSELSTYFGTEVGYDFTLGPLVLRPYLTDGLLVHSLQECFGNNCGRETENGLFTGIGAFLFTMVGPVLIGVDSTFLAPLADSDLNGGLFSLNVGVPFSN